MGLIYDENIIRAFFRTVFPDIWERTEGAFISLAARKKYIPEGIDIDLGHRPQMLDRDVVRSQNEDVYIAKLRRFTAPDAYTDNNGKPIPPEVMAVYVNVNLSDGLKAWRQTKKSIAETDEEIMTHAFSSNLDLAHSASSVMHLDGMWMSAMQNSYSRVLWIDYDIDIIPDDGAITFSERLTLARGKAEAVLSGMGVRRYVGITTRGGFHILVHTKENTFNKDVNPETILRALQKELAPYAKEVVRNGNGMVPLPGTRQGGAAVGMWLPKSA